MNKRRSQPKIAIGVEVMVIRWSRKKNVPNKLNAIYQGPLKVIGQCNVIPVNFLVESKSSSRTRKFWVHCDKLKKYIKRDESQFESSSDEESDKDADINKSTQRDHFADSLEMSKHNNENDEISNESDSSDDVEFSPSMPILSKQQSQLNENLIDLGNEVNSQSLNNKHETAKSTTPELTSTQSEIETGQSSSSTEVEQTKRSKKVTFSNNTETTEYLDTEPLPKRHSYFLRSSKL